MRNYIIQEIITYNHLTDINYINYTLFPLFKNNYPNIISLFYENKTQGIDFFNALNSKIILSLPYHNLNEITYITSNLNPTNKLYDLYINNSQLLLTNNNYQLKSKLTQYNSFELHKIHYFIEYYKLEKLNNNYLVLDISKNLPEIQLRFFKQINNDQLIQDLIDFKKIIIHKKNIINKNNLDLIEFSKSIKKF